VLALVACGGADKYGPDAGADARADVAYEKDASSDSPSVCGPVDVTGYQPKTFVPPNPPHQNKCTTKEVADYAQCQGAGVTSLCSQFADGSRARRAGNASRRKRGDVRWGVIVFAGNSHRVDQHRRLRRRRARRRRRKKKKTAARARAAITSLPRTAAKTPRAARARTQRSTHCAQSAIVGGCKSYDQAVTSPTGPCSVLLSDAAPPSVKACFADPSIADPTQREVDWLTRIAAFMCGP